MDVWFVFTRFVDRIDMGCMGRQLFGEYVLSPVSLFVLFVSSSVPIFEMDHDYDLSRYLAA